MTDTRGPADFASLVTGAPLLVHEESRKLSVSAALATRMESAVIAELIRSGDKLRAI
jgi:hypothetical protein